MRTWQSTMRVLLVALWTTVAAGCVYYNMFFNAKKKFELADKQSQTASGAAGPARFSVGNRAYEEAIERFSRVVERYPKSKWVDDAYYYIGLGYFRMGGYDKSERAFREILDNHPKSKYAEESLFWLAVCRVRSGETLAGRELLRKLANGGQKKKWRAAAWYELGELFLEEKEYDSAAAAYLTVADQYSGEKEAVEARFKAGETFRLAGQQERALEQFRLALRTELTPDLVYRIRVRMADAHLAQDQIDSGLTLLEELAGDARHADSLGVLRLKIGVGLEQAGRFEEAIKTYEEVIEKFPKTAWSAEAYYHIGYIHQKEYFDFVAARDFYTKAKDEFARSEFARKAVELSVTMATIEEYREEIAPKKAAADSTDTSGTANAGGQPDSGSIDTLPGIIPHLEERDSVSGVDSTKSVPEAGPTDPSDSIGLVPADSADSLSSSVFLPADTAALADSGDSLQSHAFPPADTALDSGMDPTGRLHRVAPPTLAQDGPAISSPPSSVSASALDLDTTWVLDTVTAIDTLVVVDTTLSVDTVQAGDSLLVVKTPSSDTAAAKDSLFLGDTTRSPDTTLAGNFLPVVDTTIAFDSTFVVDTTIRYDTVLVFDTAAVIQAEKAAQMKKTAEEQQAAKEAKLATAYFKLAEAFHTILEAPDSALFYYDALVARFPGSDDVPRALFASASILEGQLHDTAAAAERYRRVLENYRNTDYAGEAIRRLGLSGAPIDSGYPAAAYRQAEQMLLEENRPESARVLFNRVVKEFPRSLYAPMAAYAGAMAAEKTHKKEDSTVWFIYQSVIDSFPNTPYATAAKARIGEGTSTPRRERARVALEDTLQTQKVDSALAAIKAEQGDTTVIRLPKAPRPEKAGEFVYPQSELGSEPWKGSVMFKIWVDLTGRITEYEMVQPSRRQDIDLNAEAALKETFFNPDSIPPESLNMWYRYEVKVLPPAQKPDNIFNDPLWNNQ